MLTISSTIKRLHNNVWYLLLLQVKITQRILKAQDRDDPPESLEYSIQYPKAFDIGYFEITDSLGVRARITSFTQKDVNEGRIKYVHRLVAHMIMCAYCTMYVVQLCVIMAVCFFHFVMIRLDHVGTYGYCFYETSLIKHVPATLLCYTL